MSVDPPGRDDDAWRIHAYRELVSKFTPALESTESPTRWAEAAYEAMALQPGLKQLIDRASTEMLRGMGFIASPRTDWLDLRDSRLEAAIAALASADVTQITLIADALDEQEAEQIERVSSGLRRGGVAGLPPAQLLVIVFAWLVAISVVTATASDAGDSQAVVQSAVANSASYGALALVITWRILDKRDR